jgi:hypothetical protein
MYLTLTVSSPSGLPLNPACSLMIVKHFSAIVSFSSLLPKNSSQMMKT